MSGHFHPSERGYVLLTMAVVAAALFGALGLAIDVGHMFVAKTETQAFCDSAALAAALQLDGTSNGITAAQNAVANSKNSWNFDTTAITNYTLDFATSAAGPWSANPSPAGYVYARVQATAPVSLFFIPVIVSQQAQNVNSLGVGGQIPYSGTLPQGLGPFSAVGFDLTDKKNFGLVPGNQYDIQWPAYNGSRAGCGPGNPDKCFVRPTCADESKKAKQEVVAEWGASVNGYWGSSNNHTIDQEVLDVIQLNSVAIGDNIVMTNGNKNAEATALDTRVNEDGNIIDETPNAYLASDTKNLRRLIALPIVMPVLVSGVAEGNVLAYGSFLLLSNGSPSNYYASGNGNDPFCAVYVGGYTQGGTSGSGAAGYYQAKLVQ